MTFKSTFGNHYVKEEPVIRTENIVSNNIPTFGTDGRMIDSGINLNEVSTFILDVIYDESRTFNSLSFYQSIHSIFYTRSKLYTATIFVNMWNLSTGTATIKVVNQIGDILYTSDPITSTIEGMLQLGSFSISPGTTTLEVLVLTDTTTNIKEILIR